MVKATEEVLIVPKRADRRSFVGRIFETQQVRDCNRRDNQNDRDNDQQLDHEKPFCCFLIKSPTTVKASLNLCHLSKAMHLLEQFPTQTHSEPMTALDLQL